MPPLEWFKLEEYPYFSKLKKELIEALPSKGVEAELARKKDVEYIVVLLATMAKHSGGRGAMSDLHAGIKDMAKMVQASTDEALDKIEAAILRLGGGVMEDFIAIERRKRAGEFKGWGVEFAGRKVNVYAE